MYLPQLSATLLLASAPEPEVRLVRKPDRRDLVARAALVSRVASEFHELPGLCLTLSQARRLFDLRPEVCMRILDCLVVDGTLGRTSDGVYYQN